MGEPTRMSRLGPLTSTDPSQIGRYQLLGRLGAGGMGVVYLAEGSRGLVAVKTIHTHLLEDGQYLRRFQQEIQACFRVRGPYTASLLDFDILSDPPWLATEYVDGPPLEELIEQSGPLPTDAQLVLAHGLAEALTSLHAEGVVHRDLKPANVLCAASGPKVIDFGIAAAADGIRLTAADQTVGTFAWMSPERFHGEVGPPADIYAWAALVCYAATGQPPFRAPTTTELVAKVITQSPDYDLRVLPSVLAGLVRAAYSRTPGDRPTAAAIRDKLVAALADTTSPRPGAGHPTVLVPERWATPESGHVSDPGDPSEPANLDETDEPLGPDRIDLVYRDVGRAAVYTDSDLMTKWQQRRLDRALDKAAFLFVDSEPTAPGRASMTLIIGGEAETATWTGPAPPAIRPLITLVCKTGYLGD